MLFVQVISFKLPTILQIGKIVSVFNLYPEQTHESSMKLEIFIDIKTQTDD